MDNILPHNAGHKMAEAPLCTDCPKITAAAGQAWSCSGGGRAVSAEGRVLCCRPQARAQVRILVPGAQTLGRSAVTQPCELV